MRRNPRTARAEPRAPHRRLVTPVAVTIMIAPVLVLGRVLGWEANTSLWFLLPGLALAAAVAMVGIECFEGGAPWKLWARIGCPIAAAAFVMYAIGWGPTLAIGLVFVCAEPLHEHRSRAAIPSVVWSVGALAAGQLAIASGIAPTLVDPPIVHGLALLAALGVVITITQLDRANRDTEAVEARLREREERFRALAQNASDIIAVTAPDGRFESVSPAFESVLGYPAGDAQELNWFALVHDDDRDALAAALATPTSPSQTRRFEARIRRADGAYRWFDALVTDMTRTPSVGGLVANLRDVTERKATEAALAEVQAAFRYAFEDAPVGMVLASLDGRILRANRAFARLLDRRAEELVDVPLMALAHPDDRLAVELEHERLLRGDIEVVRIEQRCVRSDGTTIWVNGNSTIVRDVEGRPLYLIGQMEDVTERKALRDRLAYEATHDPMTGLANRAKFTEVVEQSVAVASRLGRRVAVMFVDLDHFKVVNDGLGHAVGDELLMTVAHRLRTVLRDADVVARFGGDEFLILCGQLSGAQAALEVADRVAEVLAKPVQLSQGEVFITASIGIALSEPGDSGETLMRHADAAMYRAKNAGRARIQIFDRRADDGAAAVLKTGTALHHAVERNELVLHYQPIVELRHGRTVGAEALVRWNHPDRGLLLPNEFLPLAEETGLIVSIGDWVLETACVQAAEWRDARANGEGADFYVSVNLSPRQLADPALATAVKRGLDRHRLNGSSLSFEITEQSLIYDTATSLHALESLRELGLQVSVDDFGSGFSSLAHLKRVPIHALKIDASFVKGVADDPEDMHVVEAVIGLAHALGLRTLAEGVETTEQLECLRKMGCDLAQGYLLGPPAPAERCKFGPVDDPLPAWTNRP